MKMIYDEFSARTVDDSGETLRCFGWPRTGGHVWETVFYPDGPSNRSICYAGGSGNTILTEKTTRGEMTKDEARRTVEHIARAIGVPISQIEYE